MKGPWITIADKYLVRELAKALAASLTFFTVLSAIILMVREMDEMLEREATLGQALQYVMQATPQIAFQTLPFALLVAVSFSLNRLARHRELQAMMIGGLRIRRLALPILIFVALFTLLIPPAYNRIAAPLWQSAVDLMDYEIKGKSDPMSGKRHIWMLGRNNRTFHITVYRPQKQGLYAVDVFEIDPVSGLLTGRQYIRQAFYQPGGGWLCLDVVDREIQDDGTVITQFFPEQKYFWDEKPDDFKRITQKPEEMSLSDLQEMIVWSRHAGRDPVRYEVYYALKGGAFPFGLLVICLIGLSFSLTPTPAPGSVSLGLSLIFAFAYYGCMAFCVSFAEKGLFDPYFGTWLPNILFGIPAGIKLLIADART